MTATPTRERSAAPAGRVPHRRAARTGALAALLLVVASVAAACGNAAPSPSAAGTGTGHSATTTTGGDSQTTTSSGGGRGDGHHGTTTTAPTTYTSTPAPEIKTPTVTINGHVYPVPVETPGTPIDSYNATGQQIVITNQGVLPYHLFANIGQPIVFTNLASVPVRMSMIGYPVTSPLIPVGGTFSYTFSTSYSVEFKTSNGHLGAIDVGAFASS